MKKTVLSIILALAAMCSATVASAQNTYTNNWFLQANLGSLNPYDNGKIAPFSPCIQLFGGRWVAPGLGFRAGVQGFLCQPADQISTWFSGESFFGYYAVNADCLWNPMRTFNLLQGNRFFNPNVYLRGSAILASSFGNHRKIPAVGGGFMNLFNINDVISVSLDVSVLGAKERRFRNGGAGSGKAILLATATVGIYVNLGITTY